MNSKYTSGMGPVRIATPEYCAYSEDSRMNSKYKSVYGSRTNSHWVKKKSISSRSSAVGASDRMKMNSFNFLNYHRREVCTQASVCIRFRRSYNAPGMGSGWRFLSWGLFHVMPDLYGEAPRERGNFFRLQGPVVRTPVSANSGLNFNPVSFSLYQRHSIE